MLREIYSDLSSFKSIRLKAGLNLIVAEKTRDATERQTRNGAGKTSFVELVHFLLGADANKDSIFRDPALEESRFYLHLDVCQSEVIVARRGVSPAKIEVSADDVSNWLVKPRLDRRADVLFVSNEEWKVILGACIFKLPGDEDVLSSAHKPTFRMLFPYFARRDNSKGFLEATAHSNKQQSGDQQIALSYLFGLNWTVAQGFEQVREKERSLNELRRMARQGTFPNVLGSSATLRTQYAVARAQVERLKSQLSSFRVFPFYEEYDREASLLQRRIRDLSDENTRDLELLELLNRSVESERLPGIGDLERLYDEAAIVLPELVRRRVEEVREFHEKIVSNRRAHLLEEIIATRDRISKRDALRRELDSRRAKIMEVLRETGALTQYTRFQEDLAQLEAKTGALGQQYEFAEKLESSRAEYLEERARLLRLLQADYHEQADRISEAVVLFGELSEELYEDPGSLTIHPTENGPKFEARIQSSRSKGINQMQIFCFDMTISVLAARRNIHPGFLIHDSHIFDGVDERQVAKALEIGKRLSLECGFQYIVTINSDSIPSREYFGEPFIEDVIIEPRLTDEEAGGLFGFRFG